MSTKTEDRISASNRSAIVVPSSQEVANNRAEWRLRNTKAGREYFV